MTLRYQRKSTNAKIILKQERLKQMEINLNQCISDEIYIKWFRAK